MPDTTFTFRDQTLNATLSLPTETPAPAVMLVHSWWGLTDHIRAVGDRLAAEGFVVFAPDLFAGRTTTRGLVARTWAGQLNRIQTVLTLQAAIDDLVARDVVAGESVGVVGFGMGSSYAHWIAVDGNRVASAVGFYGFFEFTPDAATQAAENGAAIQGHFATLDRPIQPRPLRTNLDNLLAAGADAEFHIYHDVEHDFFDDTRPTYNAEAAALAWERTLAWLRQHA
jgi:carboxymethylenebutenolidase